jgi:hypothetical protein
MKPDKKQKWFLCIVMCCAFFLSSACTQTSLPQTAEESGSDGASNQAASADDFAAYSYSAQLVKAESSIGVNSEWNDRFVVMVLLDNDYSGSYTPGDDVLYVDQADLLAQREAYRSEMLFPQNLLSNRQITAESGELILLIGGKYALTNDASAFTEQANVIPLSYGVSGSENTLDFSLYAKDRVYKSKKAVEVQPPVFYSGAAELAGIPKAGSEITCGMPLPETDAKLQLFLVQYDESGAILALSQGTADASQLTASGTVLEQTSTVKAIITDENLLPLTDAQVLTGTDGGIRMDSTPSGAEIWLDGTFQGVTPSVVPASAGEHTVQLKVPGYQSSVEIPVRVEQGLVSSPEKITLLPDLPVALPEDTVTVTGLNDVIDGDTSGIGALQANPGRDGTISLREAVAAANNTQDGNVRAIQFAPELKGQTIVLNLRDDQIGHNLRQAPLVLFDSILINGDVDGDAVPDITISAPDVQTYAFLCWSSNITFASLRFYDCYRCIGILPAVAHTPDNQLAKNIENISVVNCEFVQKEDENRREAMAIHIVGIWNFEEYEQKVMLDENGNRVRLSKASTFSDFSITGVTIVGNNITYDCGICVMGAGAIMNFNNDRIVFQNFSICANQIVMPNTAGEAFAAVQLLVTDCNNAYDGPPFENPDDYIYSDDCTIQNVLFRGNTVESTRGMGMLLGAANMGNSGNVFTGLRIDNNHFTYSNTYFACITVQVYSGMQYENARVGEENRVENLLIQDNLIESYRSGPAIELNACLASGDLPEPSARNNWFSDVSIESNVIQMIDEKEFSPAIRISAVENFKEGVYTNDAYGQNVTIRGNSISYIGRFMPFLGVKSENSIQPTYGAIAVIGALTGIYSNYATTTATATGNCLKSITIEGNSIKGTALSLFILGGYGNGADNNTVEVALKDNLFSGEILVFENAMNAAGNQVTVTEQ